MTDPSERLPHEWHLVGNIPACKHCRRAEHMINPLVGDECPARLRGALDRALDAARAEGRREANATTEAVLAALGDEYRAKHGGGGEYCRAIADALLRLPVGGGR